MSWTHSERLIYDQFKFCVQGDIKAEFVHFYFLVFHPGKKGQGLKVMLLGRKKIIFELLLLLLLLNYLAGHGQLSATIKGTISLTRC